MESLTDFFKLLSDDTRLRILVLLYHKKLCVCQLQGIMGESQPKISKHLAKLRDLGIVQDERQEQFIYYYLNIKDKLFESILKSVVDNIEAYEVLKRDIENLNDAEVFLKLCKR
ncbi:ArsR/SmtB family transcription factor [Clostridium polynesiense]|uniref:ArsR/SmtB family transcription factor n=1 Tax=Clostridium polynesiense TaxID=1325933 RepID=UPI00058F7D12|nr:metalloregulator ArsR/SmtB family transcription factor [Clostridium polynesiense]